MCFSLICCGWMLLSLVFAFDDVAANRATAFFVDHGQSAKIRCNYNQTNDMEIITVVLQTLNHTLCYVRLSSRKTNQQNCKDHIKFIWIPKTEEISFDLLNLQIKDTGTYTCTVRRIAKPPQMDLGVERVQVIVRPILSLSCVKRPDGSPMILCSVDFYPDSLEQLWITDGDVLNSSYSNKSFDGSFKQQSYLILPPQTLNDTIYSCWVNHSSLNKPLVANLSSFVCYENGGIAVTVTVVFVMLTVVLTIFLITPVICRHYRRGRQQSVSPVGVCVTPEPVLHEHLLTEILYSTLGDHHPVPCSPAHAHLHNKH
ncbi:tapasin-related protein [Labeo rohita]|uniref:tapasin-related protein n=1 Tax=Labeo rohita TaxID=84645 RepID=UPI0021E234F9|nr:tapasin-related protein [Labeo rohita]